MKKDKKPVVLVSVKVRAVAEGYYGDKIVRIGEEFVYNGGLNRKGGLPLWVEPLEKWSAPVEAKVSKVASESAPAAPAAAAPKAPAKKAVAKKAPSAPAPKAPKAPAVPAALKKMI